eukprot:gene12607-3696_t
MASTFCILCDKFIKSPLCLASAPISEEADHALT